MNNRVTRFRSVGKWVGCLVVPPLLGYWAGSVAGALGASGAAAFWFAQYRLPVWQEGNVFSFWFVAGGYGVIGLTLLICLGRLAGVRLM